MLTLIKFMIHTIYQYTSESTENLKSTILDIVLIDSVCVSENISWWDVVGWILARSSPVGWAELFDPSTVSIPAPTPISISVDEWILKLSLVAVVSEPFVVVGVMRLNSGGIHVNISIGTIRWRIVESILDDTDLYRISVTLLDTFAHYVTVHIVPTDKRRAAKDETLLSTEEDARGNDPVEEFWNFGHPTKLLSK